ncbi:MAG: D-alanyl-D-alanine carboxypeptidase [Gammaproteobacteria bacterium]|nr:D-alanyl-D-alanine carboxypeptidase [Gammaproteobacteria bacterium]MCW8839715.1 D-alanyl-D-alanine carboxypeptidase [Gammaproteobacteria bacterium]MCW8927944.1 D-alanyl-D-alanine carboxypeptidase [Gammaproteobacteria bacterium]MCW8959107.1 D-alanyl-D-alanine carboxypeptidase [Gammaproteobacteria bacterium]MCW8972664.1 D-alanyl-D-alanine carboxypeptidase [Gammaproteobacteria bacterium]
MRSLKIFTTLLLLAAFYTAQAAPSLIPSPPRLAATGYVLMDYHSGQVLASDNAEQHLEPASLTKLMTAYTVFHELKSGHIKLDDEVRISEKAWRMIGSKMFIEVGKYVTVEKLLKGMIIQSGNDASVALAEYVAGSEDAFVPLMNAHAENLGLSGTHFVNSTGLPHGEHYTTPIDMARLAAALIREFPEYYEWYSEEKYTFNSITQSNRNLLLFRDDSVDGLKTGHTEAAGYCLVASAMREGMRLITVVMGTESEKARAQESQKLLNYGFRFYETHQLYEANKPLKQMRIWKGELEQLPVGLADALFVTVPRGEYQALKASMRVGKTLVAPVSSGQSVGTVSIRLGDETLAERPLVALQEVAEGGLWQKLKDSALLLLE